MTLFLFSNPLYRFNTLIFQIFRSITFMLQCFTFDLDKLPIYVFILHFLSIHLLSLLDHMRIHWNLSMLSLDIDLSQFLIIEDKNLFEHVKKGKSQKNTKEVLFYQSEHWWSILWLWRMFISIVWSSCIVMRVFILILMSCIISRREIVVILFSEILIAQSFICFFDLQKFCWIRWVFSNIWMVFFSKLEILCFDFLLACAYLNAKSIIMAAVIMPNFDEIGSLGKFLSKYHYLLIGKVIERLTSPSINSNIGSLSNNPLDCFDGYKYNQ